MNYRRPCPLNPSLHSIDDFSSGNRDLDDWLKEMASYNQEQNFTRTFVIADKDFKVVGYHALCAGMIFRNDAPRKSKGGRAPNEIPVAILARMAVDRKYQKKGLGGALLRNALLTVISSSQLVAFRAVVVHAINAEAEQFYKHFGFSETKGMEGRLILSTKDIFKSCDQACATKHD